MLIREMNKLKTVTDTVRRNTLKSGKGGLGANNNIKIEKGKGCEQTKQDGGQRLGGINHARRGLPQSPVVKTPNSRCRVHRFNPWSGN